MLKYRLISSFVLISLVMGALFLLPKIGFTFVTLIICMLAAWEWGQLSGFTLYYERIWLALLCGLLLSIILFLSSKYHQNTYQLIFNSLIWVSLIWWFIALLLVLSYPISAVIWRNSRILRLIFGVLIIIPFFLGMHAIRILHYDENQYKGAIWLLYIMLLVWGVDSGSYVFGELFGKHKLVPKVSPRKTWQGFIGGLFTAIVISWSYSICINLDSDSAKFKLLICSVIGSLAAVLGDLTESMFKREARIKDSSHLIPGHGGILDRIDSLTAAIPVFTYLILLKII